MYFTGVKFALISNYNDIMFARRHSDEVVSYCCLSAKRFMGLIGWSLHALLWVSSRFYAFLPQSKHALKTDWRTRSLPVGVNVNDFCWFCQSCDRLATCPRCTTPLPSISWYPVPLHRGAVIEQVWMMSAQDPTLPPNGLKNQSHLIFTQQRGNCSSLCYSQCNYMKNGLKIETSDLISVYFRCAITPQTMRLSCSHMKSVPSICYL